jgi:hypothetical protein
LTEKVNIVAVLLSLNPDGAEPFFERSVILNGSANSASEMPVEGGSDQNCRFVCSDLFRGRVSTMDREPQGDQGGKVDLSVR